MTSELRAIDERIKVTERNVDVLQRESDGQIDKLREEVGKSFESIKTLLAEHFKEDTTAFHNIENALLARVPAWALTVMMIGASMIGGMATYILTNLHNK